MTTLKFPFLSKQFFLRIYWIIFVQFGLNLVTFSKAVTSLPAYWRDLHTFSKKYKGLLKIKPCLHDRFSEAGASQSEYFWQDLLVARLIHDVNPFTHVDVGSRLDGFVAHVASFRELEVFDIRPISVDIPGVTYRKIDLMDKDSVLTICKETNGYCDSLSCLHALEHFGLGRYGDIIDPYGYAKGFTNLAHLLLPGGRLYLSIPIGQERVEFNANWIFDPNTIVNLGIENGLSLEKLYIFNSKMGILEFKNREILSAIAAFSSHHYNLAIFVFARPFSNESD